MNLQNGPDIRREKLCKKERISANPLNPAKQENYQHQNTHVSKRTVIQNNRQRNRELHHEVPIPILPSLKNSLNPTQ